MFHFLSLSFILSVCFFLSFCLSFSHVNHTRCSVSVLRYWVCAFHRAVVFEWHESFFYHSPFNFSSVKIRRLAKPVNRCFILVGPSFMCKSIAAERLPERRALIGRRLVTVLKDTVGGVPLSQTPRAANSFWQAPHVASHRRRLPSRWEYEALTVRK